MSLDYNTVTLRVPRSRFSGDLVGSGYVWDYDSNYTMNNKLGCSYIQVDNKVLTQEEINNINNIEYKPDWDSNTMALFQFGGDLYGGNISSVASTGRGASKLVLNDNITNWIIYKRKRNDLTLTYVTTVPVNTLSIVDFNVLNDEEYEYLVFAETDTKILTSFKSSHIKTCWDAWSLIDLGEESEQKNLYYVDTNNIWLFNTNLQSGSLTQNIDKNIVDNFTQFPKIITGKKNYTTGKLNAFLSNVQPRTGIYKDTVTMMEAFKAMIVNGHPKLLKDRKGNGWVVDVTENSFEIIDKSEQQIVKVDFSFVQLNDSNEINAIS